MANIKEISKLAGVSLTTVSKALNGYSDVSEETRKKIIQIANELDYRPNAIARSLVKKSSNTFGYIVSGLHKHSKHSIVLDSLVGIYDYSGTVDYEILTFAVDSKKQLAKSYMQFAREHSLAGVIIQGIKSDDEYYREVLDSQIHCVLIDIPAESVRVGSISTDNTKASYEIVKYLIDLGHKNIAFMNGSDTAAVSVTRYNGYINAMHEHGLVLNPKYILSGEYSEEVAFLKMSGFIAAHPEVTAVFCASDLMAIGVIKAIRNLGLNVPKDVSVVGFDDIVLSPYINPPLTTVRQNFYEMGYEAAKMLHGLVLEKDVPHTRTIPYEIVIRESACNKTK